jgi:uncharacterized membrane protein HdeD (DUF308 family)
MNTFEKQLATILSRRWWTLLLRGLAAILFGVLVWLLPNITLAVLVLSFGAYVLLDGTAGIWIAFAGRKSYEDWWLLLLWGLVGIGVGILTFLSPVVTELALVFFIAVWAIATGILHVVIAIQLRKEIRGEWLLILDGLLSVAFGVFLMVRPEAGALALIWLIGIYAVAFGIVLVILAFKMRSFGKQLSRGGSNIVAGNS